MDGEAPRPNALGAPISIYEVHLGSWRRVPEEGNRSLTYREMAPLLADYVNQMGFTHVEFLPVMEHPFYGSWGYQTTGYFAPTSRYGTPQDFMYLVDYLHRHGIGVILDWVPSHFPDDEYGLGFFDGTHLYEHADPSQGIHPDWNSYIFNYGRNEVRSFLYSSAVFWLDKYHADGLRVDAVASMLYLDYGRRPASGCPTSYGGRENLEAIDFLKKLNETVYGVNPDIQTIAEESTAWPMVSRPTYAGGLGFGMKWDMGWMHDTLVYITRDPVYRKYHQNDLTFRMIYAFTENFILPLSHDEVVYGKASLLGKMPGDDWQKFASLQAAAGLYVRAARQEAPLHGRGVRAAAGMVPRGEPGMAPAPVQAAPGAPEMGRRPQRPLPGRAGPPGGLRAGRLPVDRRRRLRAQHHQLPEAGAVAAGYHPVRRQFHAADPF